MQTAARGERCTDTGPHGGEVCNRVGAGAEIVRVGWTALAQPALDLAHRSVGLQNGVTMVHDPAQIGIGKRDAAEGGAPNYFAWRRLSRLTEEEAGLRAEIGVPPAVQD